MDAGKGNSAKAPAISFTNKVNNYRDSDLWLRDASYLRLKNVEIGYNFPKKILSKINIRSLRVFATGYNLLTLDILICFFYIMRGFCFRGEISSETS